ncbi:MAG: YibE/F family protein [Desulfobacteraceae bacterium]|nr:YibE/F family protein [Desulfobacteraceae bacterium]
MVVLLISAGLFLFVGPKGPEGVTASARIIEMEDNTELKGGWLKIGWQKMTARILRGPYRGEKITVDNGLVGNLMLDRYVEVEDRALFMLDIEEGEIRGAKLVDYDRQSWHLIMFIIFAALLILFARYTGVKAFVSFIFTVVVLVKILLPAILKGYDALFLSVSLAALMATVTLLLVGGFSIRTLAAIVGVTIGMILSASLTVLVGQGMHLRGITSDFAVKLLFSGYSTVNLDRIFWGAVILSASGALLDIAISVATAIAEVVKANPALGVRRLIRSGFAVGQAELSTMVSTLLLAYIGYSLFLVLTLTAKGTSLVRILNMNVVSAVILRTLAGGIGMVMVAPITALIAGILYHRFYGLRVRINEGR